MFMNRFSGIGNVTDKPELMSTPKGKKWTKFSIAINEFKKNSEGKTDQFTTYIPVVAWDRYAENICRAVKKGQPILVQGPIRVKHYKDEDGVKKTAFQVEGNFFSWTPNWSPKSKEVAAEDAF